MLKILNGKCNSLCQAAVRITLKRFFLSNAYKCTETWENRLKNPVFSKINFENLYHDLDNAFQRKVRISLLDIDLLANSVNNPIFSSDVEDLLVKLRSCPESAIVPERTNHAFIRWLMDNTPKEVVLGILGDRLQFGLFPDYYLMNLLMDKFLKEGDSVSAVKIAVLQMLQEDFDHPIMKVLALHCCYNYLASADVWKSLKEEADPDEEVKRMRVKYKRNPYFDDHFDITNTNHFVGKTLWLFGRSLGGSVGASSQLVGLVLYEKYEKCASFLEDVIKNKVQLHEQAVQMAKEFAMKRPKENVENTAEDKPEGEKDTKSSESPDEWKSKVLKLVEKLDRNSLIKENLLSETSKLVKKAVEENEKKDIELQCQMYQQWEKEREQLIDAEIKRSELKKVQSEINKVKQEIQEEEEKIFYFEREDELEIIAKEQEEKMATVVHYQGKRKQKDRSQDEYIPPTVNKTFT